MKNQYLLPVAIIIAGLVLAVAVYMVRVADNPGVKGGDPDLVRPVDASDHIVGNPNAPVKIVEYSDIDCQYCKQFQAVMAQIMTEYGANGEVAWVYRHFPVLSAHANSGKHAEAAECVASLGGDTAFFQFIDALQQSSGSGQFLPSGYGAVVESLGLSTSAFATCIEGDEFEARVAQDFDNALLSGGSGAPYTIVLIEGAKSVPITGALPYESMKEVIETALSKVAP